jgi:hypothetical protein
MDKYMTLSEFKGYVISAALASAVLFGYGYHNTIDALIVTSVWIFLAFSVLAVVMITFFTYAIRKHKDRSSKELAPFYKAISAMHNHGFKRLFSFLFVGYWLYALILQEWTVTAVIYFITVFYMQVFVYLTKDLAKDFFVEQLKGEGVPE